MTLRVLDLFSGIGGFSLGLERTGGFQTVAFCEIEPFCRRVLAMHWPEVPCYDDVRTLTATRLADDGIGIDVMCGGFPCQDISDAGRRQGLEGERSGLWREYARLIGEVRPRFIIVENVAALLGRGLDRILKDLASLGYDAEWHCIPACAVGADHERDRIWVIAYPNSAGFEVTQIGWGQQCSQKMGKDDSEDYADANCSRLPRRLLVGADARAISAWLGFALSVAPAFPGLDGAGSPVLGRGENGIPNRVERLKALGNAVVPQIPELIGNAILQARGGMTAPLTSRAAIEKAAHWLRLGRVPARPEAERIVKALDAMALAMALASIYERRDDRELPKQLHQQEA